VTSLVASREWAGAAARFGARALRGRGGGKDALIQLNFLRGWLGGIWRLAAMGRAERRALLGCAAAPSGGRNAPSALEERAQSR